MIADRKLIQRAAYKENTEDHEIGDRGGSAELHIADPELISKIID